MTPALELTGVTKAYPGADGPVPVLRGVDVVLNTSETLALTGESGSGKSTLLHLAAGLETADTGTVCIAGTDITPLSDTARAGFRRSEVAVVFQQFNLIPSLSVADNIRFQARLAGRSDAALEARLTERLGLAAHVRKYPEALSGGQQQRVAIARALAVRPKVLLADEPTGNLDEATAATVMDEMLHLVSEVGAALLLVTHSAALAGQMSRRLHLSNGRLA